MAKLPEDRPSARDTVARVQAAAAPKIARAQAKAGPAAEKAAANAGKLLGTLRDRARTTLKEFSDAYGSDDAKSAEVRTIEHDDTGTHDQPRDQPRDRPAAGDRPRPRPRPTKD